MKEHPILFSTPMVQAILEGRKTHTRRIVKAQSNQKEWLTESLLNKAKNAKFLQGGVQIEHPSGGPLTFIQCPYGQPGDLLWVRETWQTWALGWIFKSSYGAPLPAGVNWRPSIHMPKDAARIWLQIEEVKVERLQDISEEDVLCEGVQIPVSENNKIVYQLGVAHSALSFLPDGCFAKGMPEPTPKQVIKAFFAELWVKINGIESWHENPWVWVVKFKVLSTTGKPEFN